MATQTHSPFESLARVIEHLDDDGRSVRRTEAAGSGEDGALRATVDVSVGSPSEEGAALEPTEASVDDGLAVTFRAPAFPDPAETLPAAYPPVSATPTDVWLDEGTVVVTLTVTIGGGDWPGGEADAAGDEKAAEAADEPASAASGSAATAAFGGRSTRVDVGDGIRSTVDVADGRGDASTEDIGTRTEADKADTDGTDETGADGADEADVDTDGADAAETSPLAAVRDESVPPYDDTPYLRRLYETCETFAEMSERIEMDVSAETVRRYMIEADVHAPTTYETAGGARASSDEPTDATDGSDAPSGTDSQATTDGRTAASLPDEQLVTDGIGLPEELTLHDVVDAVVDARTVHEVQREIGLGYDRTRQLLDQLNVLDLVVGRVADGSDRTVTVDRVADRIRQYAPDTA